MKLEFLTLHLAKFDLKKSLKLIKFTRKLIQLKFMRVEPFKKFFI